MVAGDELAINSLEMILRFSMFDCLNVRHGAPGHGKKFVHPKGGSKSHRYDLQHIVSVKTIAKLVCVLTKRKIHPLILKVPNCLYAQFDKNQKTFISGLFVPGTVVTDMSAYDQLMNASVQTFDIR